MFVGVCVCVCVCVCVIRSTLKHCSCLWRPYLLTDIAAIRKSAKKVDQIYP